MTSERWENNLILISDMKNEEEILAQQEDPIVYNDTVLYPDKIRINLLYLERQSLILDFKLIVQTVLGGFDESKW